MCSNFSGAYNWQTVLWAAGRPIAQALMIVALLLAALWAARLVIAGGALGWWAVTLLLANPLVLGCLVGMVAYAYVTYPKGPVRR